MRARLVYTNVDGSEAGSRFFLSYTGSAPSAANCSTLASDIATQWGTHLAPLVNANDSLTEVDVLDIATETGASGTAIVSTPGTNSGLLLTANTATNVEYNIARRYRGGKPRMFLPAPASAELNDAAHWTGSFITAVNTGMAAFFTAIEALSIGSMGTLQHVNLSYYKGFTNITNSSGRERAVPTYRAAALLDTVTGYACKGVVGSQRRRRTATTP